MKKEAKAIRDYFKYKWNGICRNGHRKDEHNNKCSYCVAVNGYKMEKK